MAITALRAPTAPTPARHSPDDILPALLRRLLEPSAPRLADALPAWRSERDDAALLSFVARSGGVSHRAVASIDSLSGTADRALCIAPGRRPVLLEREGGGWNLSLDGAAGRPAARRALAALFPCEVWFVAEAASEAAGVGPGARGAGLIVALRLAAQLLGLAMPVTMLLIIDRVVTQGAVNTLTALLIGLALLTVFQYLFLWLHALVAVRRGELTAHPDRCAVFRTLVGSRGGARWSSQAWDVLQVCADQARFDAETRPQVVADGLFVVLLGALMAAFSPRLLAVVVAFLPLYVAVEVWSGRRARGAGEQMTALRGTLSRRFLETAAAVEMVRGMGLAPHLCGQWQGTDADLAAVRSRHGVRRRQAALAVEFLQKLSVIVIMLLGVGAVIEGDLTLGQYIAFNLLSMQLAAPVLRLAAFRRALQDRRVAAAARAHLEQDCGAMPWPRGGTLSLPRRERLSLQVDRLAVGGADANRLGSLSFGLLGGSWVGVCGPSGCGKSTLLRALAGVEAPRRGSVRLNGVEVGLLRREHLTSRVRLVPQEPVIFTTSVAENIRLGDPAAPPARIAAVAMVCGLGPLVEALPDHLNSVIGAGGRPLSGGERQRVALARALLCEPELLLLDEATAALDGAGEARLLDGIRRFLPRAAVVLVAHRSESLFGCREILRLGPAG